MQARAPAASAPCCVLGAACPSMLLHRICNDLVPFALSARPAPPAPMKACHLCLLACLAAVLLGGTTAQLDGLLGAVGGAVGGALSDRECGCVRGRRGKAWGLSGKGKVWAVGTTWQFHLLQALRSASLLDISTRAQGCSLGRQAARGAPCAPLALAPPRRHESPHLPAPALLPMQRRACRSATSTSRPTG